MVGIGELIRVNRVNKKITQAMLSEGICTEVSLSRIESGRQVPSRGTFEALMEALGLSPGVYPSFLTNVDKKAYELQHDFDKYYSEEKYTEAAHALDKLEKLPKLELPYEQLIAHGRILIKQQQGMTSGETVEAFEVVIKTFIKNFSVSKIRFFSISYG